MEVVDLSHKLQADVPIFPGDPQFACCPTRSVDKDGYSIHTLFFGSHTGTHIDAPSHFIIDGKPIDQIPLEMLVGPALVIDLSQNSLKDRQKIIWADIKPYASQMKPSMIILLFTGWSLYWGKPKYFDHPFLDRQVAEEILARGVRVIGLDTLSPDETRLDGSEGEGFPVHQAVLGAQGVIAENLNNMQALGRGSYTVSLAPLNVTGCDGSPVRAFAWRKSD